MASLPSWVVALIKLAISVGSPYLLRLIQDWIKNLPPEIVQLITDLIRSLTDPKINNAVAKAEAREKLKACTVGCPPGTKGNV